MLFPSNRQGGSYNLFVKSLTGAGQEEVFLKLGTPTGWATDWSKDGRHILLMAAAVRAVGASFETSAASRLFVSPPVSGPVVRDEYAVSADGKRFLVSRTLGNAAADPITVVVNWRAALKR